MAGGQGFPPAIMNMTPAYFHSKVEPKELVKISTLKRKLQ